MTNPLISIQQQQQLRRKSTLPAFAAAVSRLQDEVQAFLDQPSAVEAAPGGYYHDYFCPQHGLQLCFDADEPRVHRCPVDNAVFSGEPFDSAWRWFVNNRLAETARKMAVLWQLTDDEQCRNHVECILLDYADRYAGYAAYPPQTANPGVATYTTLDESVWAIPLAWAFDIICTTLPVAEQTVIVDKLLIPIAEHLTTHHFGAVHNFGCWHNAAIGTLGIVTGREDLTAAAINGPHGFYAQVQDGVLADGLWYEGSFSYHFYTVAALFALAQATMNQPRWNLCNLEVLAAVLRAPAACTYPDGTLPATNDCWYFTGLIDECCHGIPKAPAFYEMGYGWFEEELFGQLLARAYAHGPRDTLEALLYGRKSLPDKPLPQAAATHLPATGYAILRTQGKVDPQYILLKYGPHGGGHGHPDKLALTLFAHGTRLSPDLGYARLRA